MWLKPSRRTKDCRAQAGFRAEQIVVSRREESHILPGILALFQSFCAAAGGGANN